MREYNFNGDLVYGIHFAPKQIHPGPRFIVTDEWSRYV